MNAALNLTTPEICRRSFQRSRRNGRAKTQRQDRRKEAVQVVYAHLPPATVLAVEQHLRAQTQIEQRAQQLWFAAVGRPVSAANDWLRAEREVVNELCEALLRREPHPASALH